MKVALYARVSKALGLSLIVIGLSGVVFVEHRTNVVLYNKVDSLEAELVRLEQVSRLVEQAPNLSNGGEYWPSGKFYWVKTTSDPETIFRNGLHEYSHYVYYQLLSGAERSEWNNISTHSLEFVSEYAGKNEREDFAETLSYSIACAPRPNNVSDDRLEYLERKVFPVLKERGVLR